MPAQLQTCAICHKRMAEVLMVQLGDGPDAPWICPSHNHPMANAKKKERRKERRE